MMNGMILPSHLISLRSKRDKMVHFVHGVVINFIMQRNLMYFTKKLTRCDELCFPSFCLFEPHREKTGFLPRRKQRRRSASR